MANDGSVFKSFYWVWDFGNMTLANHPGGPAPLEVRNGLIGWTDLDGYWHKGWSEAQKAYDKWLDRQIYGESNG